MNKRERIEKVILYGVFICYTLLLLKILFLSRISLSGLFDSQRSAYRSINLIPFYSIIDYLSGGTEILTKLSFANVAGNIIIFIPFGVYLPLFRKDKKIMANLFLVIITSLFVEVIQWIFGIGTADIDDIILNCIGGLIGILGYKILSYILRVDKNTHTVITILSIIGLPVILYYLLLIKMQF